METRPQTLTPTDRARPRIAAALAVLAAAGACVPVPAPDPAQRLSSAACLPAPEATRLTADLRAEVNRRRLAAGLVPLVPSPRLDRAAAATACDNAGRGRMTHVLADGTDLRGRLRGQGYGFRQAHEAIGYGYREPGRLVAVWAASGYHRDTILAEPTREMGAAVVLAPDGTPFWVLVAARPG